MGDTARISVVRGKELVPLLESPAPTADQPWRGMLLETHAVRPGEIPEHDHPDLCLHLQHTGDAKFEWWSGGRNRVEATRPGALILIPPGTRDRLVWRGSSDRTILSVRNAAIEETCNNLGLRCIPELQGHWALHDPGLARLIEEMAKQSRTGFPLGALYADLLAQNLTMHLLRTQSTAPLLLSERKGGLPMPSLKRVLELINAHLGRDIRLEEIARVSGRSPSHFAHEFRRSTGQTPYQYLLDQRMQAAKNLLRRTDRSIQMIGAEVGFPSPVNFVRAFRQRIGISPGVWRSQN